ncbi:MAG: alpha/beta hydrolase [Clostridia bacterium]|nr:alpha/beta hydrolase [Clostridia bacterium]
MMCTIDVNGEKLALKDGTVKANGQRIHYVEAGEGPMALLVHGFPEFWYSWKHQLLALSKAGYRAVAIDTRGVGRSSKPEDYAQYTLKNLACDCAETVKALGEKKAAIIGHDWGAIIAWSAAWFYPECFSGVVGISNVFGGRDAFALPLSEGRTKLPSQIYREIAGEDKIFYSDNFAKIEPALIQMDCPKDWLFNALFGWSHLLPKPQILIDNKATELTDEQIVELFRGASVCSDRYAPVTPSKRAPVDNPYFLPEEDLEILAANWESCGFRHALYYYKAVDLDWELYGNIEERIKIPALYIGGDRDWVTIWSRDAIANLPKVCDDLRGVKVLENCGHWEEIERPNEVSSLILDFLKSL